MDMATVVEKTKVSMGATYGATFGKDRWEQKNSGDKTFIVKEVYASLKKEGARQSKEEKRRKKAIEASDSMVL